MVTLTEFGNQRGPFARRTQIFTSGPENSSRSLGLGWNTNKTDGGPLTSEVTLRAAVFSAQPPKQRPHHLGTAKTLETGTDVLVVPLQSADLENPLRRKQRVVNKQ